MIERNIPNVSQKITPKLVCQATWQAHQSFKGSRNGWFTDNYQYLMSWSGLDFEECVQHVFSARADGFIFKGRCTDELTENGCQMLYGAHPTITKSDPTISVEYTLERRTSEFDSWTSGSFKACKTELRLLRDRLSNFNEDDWSIIRTERNVVTDYTNELNRD